MGWRGSRARGPGNGMVAPWCYIYIRAAKPAERCFMLFMEFSRMLGMWGVYGPFSWVEASEGALGPSGTSGPGFKCPRIGAINPQVA